MKAIVFLNVRWAACALLAAAALIAVASPVYAAPSCKTWAASKVEDEGGPAMTATVCTDGTYASPTLTLQCGYLRYDLGEKVNATLQEGISAEFEFTSGTDAVSRKFQLEAMDYNFAAELEKDDPLLTLLRHGQSVSVADKAGKYPVNTFSLKGSGAAIDKVMASCGASSGDDSGGD